MGYKWVGVWGENDGSKLRFAFISGYRDLVNFESLNWDKTVLKYWLTRGALFYVRLILIGRSFFIDKQIT